LALVRPALGLSVEKPASVGWRAGTQNGGSSPRVVAQFEKFVIPKRGFIARGICFGRANSRFLTGKERRFGMTK
jgi:hypothetical protein